jgi:hypothetical protein
MKTSTVLKIAKINLRGPDNPGGEQFICWAVGMVDGITDRQTTKIKQMITERLGCDWTAGGGTNTLELWLAAEHGIPEVKPIWQASSYGNGIYRNAAEVKAYRDKIQRTRHAWVDSMIKEFEAQGD